MRGHLAFSTKYCRLPTRILLHVQQETTVQLKAVMLHLPIRDIQCGQYLFTDSLFHFQVFCGLYN